MNRSQIIKEPFGAITIKERIEQLIAIAVLVFIVTFICMAVSWSTQNRNYRAAHRDAIVDGQKKDRIALLDAEIQGR